MYNGIMRKVVIAISPVNYVSPRRQEAQKTAIEVLSRLPENFKVVALSYDGEKPTVPLPHNIENLSVLKRNSEKEIGNQRPLPYIKEILGLTRKLECDVFGYINSDILVGSRFIDNLSQERDAYVFARSDIAEVNAMRFLSGAFKVIFGGDKHPGADGFFFSTEWWDKNSHLLPDDLIIGETEWDTCYRHIIRQTKNFMEDRCLYHVYHDAKWDSKSVGGKNNVRILNEVINRGKTNDVIPLKFSLFWSGAKMSYLRYLTFKSLRHFHPDATIYLCVSEKYDKSVHNWSGEQQDFEKDASERDYLELLPDLGVIIDRVDSVGDPGYCPILQADIFRWVWLKENGGFYLDTDQIIVKSFAYLPLDKEFIYSRYNEVQCGDYCPVGVLGLQKGSPIADIALDHLKRSYRSSNYNSSGPFMMRNALAEMDLKNSFNAPWVYFYPANSSSYVPRIYDGSFVLPKDAFAVHWFGGHPASQEFNQRYTEQFAATSGDSLTRILKIKGVL